MPLDRWMMRDVMVRDMMMRDMVKRDVMRRDSLYLSAHYSPLTTHAFWG
jgi:hypothetical protein